MRFPVSGFVLAFLFLVFAPLSIAHAGIFGGNSQLGIIKKSVNVFEFISPDGEVIDEGSVRNAAARTAKLLGFSHFLIDVPVAKPAAKPKPAKSGEAPVEEPVVEEPKPLTSVMVYFYNGPRSRNGVKSIPVTDIIPDEPKEEPAPVVEAEKPAPKKKKEVAPEIVTAPVEPAPVVEAEKPAPKKKKEIAPEVVTAPVAPAPVVEAEKPAPKKKKEIAPEVVTAPVAPAPVVEAEKPISPVEDVLKTKEAKKAKPVLQQAPQAVTQAEPVVDAEQAAPPKPKKRNKPYVIPGQEVVQPDGQTRVRDLGDIFN